MRWRTVTLAVDTTDDEDFIRVHEHLSRMCAGLVLSGDEARVFAYTTEDEEAEAEA